MGFPGGMVGKDLSANAGYMGLTPGPGRLHTTWSNISHGPQVLKHEGSRAGALHPEEPPH